MVVQNIYTTVQVERKKMSQITTNNLSRLTELSNKEKQVIYGGTAADSAAAISSTATAILP